MASVPNDAEGRLPLHLVLDAGMVWLGEDDYRGCNDNNNEVIGDSLVPLSLIDACPRTLEIKDGKSGLMPFMIAATQKSWNTDFNENVSCKCKKLSL